eukprot:SAG31_NODE_1228_length_9228_cov_5.337386_8_plen_133_part_00
MMWVLTRRTAIREGDLGEENYKTRVPSQLDMSSSIPTSLTLAALTASATVEVRPSFSAWFSSELFPSPNDPRSNGDPSVTVAVPYAAKNASKPAAQSSEALALWFALVIKIGAPAAAAASNWAVVRVPLRQG